jgi:hypothetical protein
MILYLSGAYACNKVFQMILIKWAYIGFGQFQLVEPTVGITVG